MGMVRRGSLTSSPMVAIRAYPANAKNSSAADCSTPRQHHNRQEHPCHPRGPRHPDIVEPSDHQDRQNTDRLGPMVRNHVLGESERHRSTARGLTNDETPPCDIPCPLTKPLTPIDISTAGDRVLSSKLSR